MDMGELLTALENHIFQFAVKQFERNEIPITLQRLIMEAVYSKFQGKAIDQMIANQIRVVDKEPDPEKVTQSKENVQETVETLNDFYEKTDVIGEETTDGNTEQAG